MAAPIPLKVPVPAVPPQQVKPPTVLLMGPINTGKTDSIATLLEAGLEVFVIVAEANGLDSLLDSCKRRKLSTEHLHWRYIPPATPNLDAIELMAKRISDLSFADLSNLKQGIGKEDTRQFMELLSAFKNFVDDKDGTPYGSVFSFDDSKALVIDSMTGINMMAMDLTIGMKPTASEGEWGVAMNLQLKTIQLLTSSLKCFFVLTAHIGKEPAETDGGTVIKDFRWSSFSPNVDLKARAFPISDDIRPSFEHLRSVHLRRLAQSQEDNPE